MSDSDPGSTTALDPEVARKVQHLTLQARRAVEGLLQGIHRSPHRGASVVFVEHREYRPGDDLRLLDWRAFARTDRHQIKRFEQETQLRATLVLDRSGSMAFGGKAEHAATLLGALAYVLVNQGDAAGVLTFDEELRDALPPRSRPAHLEAVLGTLVAPAERGRRTDLAAALRDVAERSGRRGVVAIASDLLDLDDEHALDPLASLVAHGHDVIVFHVMHPAELDLPFDAPARFAGLEGEDDLDADPELLREGYQQELARFLESTRSRCTAAGARYALARTDEAPERTLAGVLGNARRRGWGR
jgi:uncharacterized protein (DUF58 family)